jgi:prephenate dehydrogenase/predicted amino acid-binding ACT domain protein
MNNSVLDNLSFVVFGGHGSWGSLIRHALENAGKDPQIIVSESTAEARAKAIKDNDVVVFAISDVDTFDMLNQFRHIFIENPGKVFIDCASSKSRFADMLREVANAGTSVCSTHPMVKPDISSVRGQNVIIMPLGTQSQRAKDIAEYLFKNTLGMNSAEPQFDNLGDVLEQHADLMVVLQMIPHFTQRILLDALGQGIPDKFGTIKDISRFAPANYFLSELGFGRVATQLPKASAEIIATAIQTDFGQQMFGGIQQTMGQIVSAGRNREKLIELFENGLTKLDPSSEWREEMADKTEVALIRLGNLRSRSLQVKAIDNIGILRDILNVLVNHEINMTALDSQVINDTAIFDIGITDENIDFERLKSNLDEIGATIQIKDRLSSQT